MTARFNSGVPDIPIDEQVLCLGLPCFTPQDAEEYAEHYIDALLTGRHLPKIWSGGNSL